MDYGAEEREAIRAEGVGPDYGEQVRERVRAEQGPAIRLRNASEWMQEPQQEPDQILADVFDRGDKLVIIGSSKTRKTFFTLQLILSVAAGRPFLGWTVPQPRTILHAQYEIQAHHFHKRLIRMCRAMNIEPADLGDRLQILNARGAGLTGQAAIDAIKGHADAVRPELISIDPLYKVLDGDENSNGKDGMKPVLAAFDKLTEDTGAAVSYVHHDSKGAVGDRQTTDRGAGGGVLGRDYDSAIVLTQHATEDGAFVVETAIRNYSPQEPFTILWTESENGGYCFEMRPDILPAKKTSKTKAPASSMDAYLPAAFSILTNEELEIAVFKAQFKAKSGLGDSKIKDFMAWAISGGNPALSTREERGIGLHKKWVRMGKTYAQDSL
jgi:hypothetical protein